MSMNFSSYLQKILQAQTAKNPFGTGSISQNTNTDELLSKLSLFTQASAEDLENIDMEKLLEAETASEALGENATADDKLLAEMVKALMGLDGVQTAADADSDGKLSAEEATAFLNDIIGKDGDVSSLTMEDIDTVLGEMGINLQEIAEQTIKDTLNEDIETIEEKKKTEEPQQTSASQASSSSQSAGGSGNTGGSSNVGGNSSRVSNVATKSAAETVEELEAKKQEIIQEADKNIADKQQEKDELVENNEKIDKDLKEEYNTNKTALEEVTSKKNDTQSDLDGYNSDLSGVENDIASLKAEQGALKTNTNDEDVNSKNKSRLGEITNKLSSLDTQEKKLKENIKKAEEKIKNLEKQEKEKQKALDAVEAKIAKADPELGKKMTAINKEIETLKTNKSNDVADIDSQIKAKRAEAKEEAKQTGETKGNIASGTGAVAAMNLGLSLEDLTAEDMKAMMRAEGYQFDDKAWCADFQRYIIDKTIGIENTADWYKNCTNKAYCPTIEQAAKDAGAIVDISEAKPGDLVTFTRDGRAGHIAMIVSVNSDGTITTIEGNTSDDNGNYTTGVVNQRVRSDYRCIMRVTA